MNGFNLAGGFNPTAVVYDPLVGLTHEDVPEAGYPVQLHVYDLSQGMARALSMPLAGRQVDGIWHTGVVVYGKEYFYGGGINAGMPGQTPYGTPVQTINLGNSHVPPVLFADFLRDASARFAPEQYCLISNNCNNFSDECSNFLVGTPIPAHITGLPQELLATPIGQMFGPMIQNMTTQMRQGNLFAGQAAPTTTTTATPTAVPIAGALPAPAVGNYAPAVAPVMTEDEMTEEEMIQAAIRESMK